MVYQKPGVLGWRIHTGCPRLEALTGVCVCVCVCVYFVCFEKCIFASFCIFLLKLLFFSGLYGLSISCCVFLCLFVLIYDIGIKFDMIGYEGLHRIFFFFLGVTLWTFKSKK